MGNKGKYNILITLNSSYFDYGKVLIKSLLDKNDMENVRNVFISDIGLEDEHKDYFTSLDDKITILDFGSTAEFGGTFGEGWQFAVASKTITLLRILERFEDDVMMIDSDCMIMNPLSELISKEHIQVCNRQTENKQVPFLASYIYIRNTDVGKEFVSEWINELENSTYSGPRESPALSRIVKTFNQDYIKHIDRVLVSCYRKEEFINQTREPYIIHFKGSSKSKTLDEDKQKRLYGKHGFYNEVQNYLD